MGMIGHKVDLSPYYIYRFYDWYTYGRRRKKELLSVLAEMAVVLDPKILVRNNEALEALNRLFKKWKWVFGDMIFKQYEHDINVVDTFINKGMFGKLKK
jgi:hypothetical protein